ncbi:YybH family protein [Aestuariivivens insulae]|uniref:YybH family protein n=1 Tax=Aestuariivivens insulae TaxID=1621988 RepID=UPI001F59EE7F|nr:nuclear transport factor 2 family protein [Aestuariivivens insulae]
MKKPISLFTFAALLILCISLIASCKNQTEDAKETTPEPTFDLAAAKAEIVAANNMFAERFNAKDSIGVANLYTPDGKVMMHGAPAVVGRDNIQSAVAGFINSGISVDLTTIDVWGTEDLITEEGLVELYAGEDKVDECKYIVLWKKVDGKWHLFRDIFNSNLAPSAHAE